MTDQGEGQNDVSPDYEFNNKNSRRKKEDAKEYLEMFAKRLRLDLSKIKSDDNGKRFRKLLSEYVCSHHCAIAWYHAKKEKEIEKSNGFRCWTISLLVIIPLALAAIPFALENSRLALVV